MLERHPNLKILAVHGGGYLASYSGRIDHAWGARSDATATCRSRRRATSRRSTSTRWCSRRTSSQELVRLYGADRIMMGTDYPFDMADYDPVGHVCGAGLDAATVAAICGGNAAKLLGL